MTDAAQDIISINIEDEMQKSYLDYAMSVIVGRALPDVRDGLKPVHRRALYSMSVLNNDWNKAYKKSARIVGDTIGKYHPHGDTAVYDTIVRMAQPFSLRYMLVDGQGNFGCFTGETKIKLLDGSEKSFAELAKLPKDEIFYVYSVNANNEIVVGKGSNARITRPNAQLIELTLDNGEKIQCTPDHRFMLRDGSYKEAQDLTATDSLMPAYFDTAPIKTGLNDYLRVFQPTSNQYEFVHHIADKFNQQNGTLDYQQTPFVRHHKDFNRWNNNPDNIQRMEFLAHLHLHAQQIKTLWQDDNFRQRQRAGVQRYYKNNPKVIVERKNRFIAQNKNPQFRKQNGQANRQRMKNYFQQHPEKRAEISKRMKALWQDADYRKKMQVALSGLDKRPLSPAEKRRVAKIISEKSRLMWANDNKRAEITAAIVRALSSASVRQKLSDNAKRNWQNPSYRAKFAKNHFSNMAKAFWSKPDAKKLHQEKIAKQRQDAVFCEAQRLAVQQSNAKRLADNPNMMAELAQKSAESLKAKWTQADYKQQVMQTKIAGYVHQLLSRFNPQQITAQVYDENRHANWIPRFKTALKYFNSHADLLNAGQCYNHKIISKRLLDKTVDTYDIEVEEHHNFLLSAGVFVHNSVDGDSPAAMRYTEIRMAKIAHELLADLDKETVDFTPNYDETEFEPSVFPTRLPNLLINGSSGIAVGMATNIPPHNLGETIDACVALLDQPDLSVDELMRYIPGPDFPTAGIINGAAGIREAYRTGRGRIYVRAKTHFETTKTGRDIIVVTELPYQVNKARLVEKIAELVKTKKIEGISELRDESDKDGMRMVIVLRQNETPEVVLNNLFKQTAMQTVFGINMVALVERQPKLLNLQQMLSAFISHRREVVTRRTLFDLGKARAKAHILEGLAVALANIDAIIKLIKAASQPSIAKEDLLSNDWHSGVVTELLASDNADASKPEDLDAGLGLQADGIYRLSEKQAQAILELRLHRLTGLEKDKVFSEYKDLLTLIGELLHILSDPDQLKKVIHDELLAMKHTYQDERRTLIIDQQQNLSLEDLITEEEMVVTLSHAGYAKSQLLSSYTAQRRGGKGKSATKMKDEDFIDQLFVANSHDTILCFSNHAKVYWLKVYELPQASRNAKGKPMVNLLPLEKDEKINAILPVKAFDADHYVFMATSNGTVKKTALSAYSKPRANGIIALTLAEGDQLVDVVLTDGNKNIMLFGSEGKVIHFCETNIRPIGRTARGVRGIRLDLDQNEKLIALLAMAKDSESTILTATINGYGKRTKIDEYPLRKKQGSKGVIAIKTSERNGAVVGAVQVGADDDVMLITDKGTLVRTPVAGISTVGRNTQGVNLIKLNQEENLVGLARIIEIE